MQYETIISTIKPGGGGIMQIWKANIVDSEKSLILKSVKLLTRMNQK